MNCAACNRPLQEGRIRFHTTDGLDYSWDEPGKKTRRYRATGNKATGWIDGDRVAYRCSICATITFGYGQDELLW